MQTMSERIFKTKIELIADERTAAKAERVYRTHHISLNEAIRAFLKVTADDGVMDKIIETARQTKDDLHMEGTPIEETGFETKILNALKRTGIYTIEELSELTDFEILCIPGLGDSALFRIRTFLSAHK